ncbi:MmyB family transcriptional regulator [Nocardia sp. NBC_00403]|uniref:MmyB family transcriptional regulator n=1 Tax=Nocardia sp. NBC_00403 TaxID=2975990 RepID=UPI002E1B997E
MGQRPQRHLRDIPTHRLTEDGCAPLPGADPPTDGADGACGYRSAGRASGDFGSSSSVARVVLSARYDVLAHNEPYEALRPGFSTGERNVARRVFLTPECWSEGVQAPRDSARRRIQ